MAVNDRGTAQATDGPSGFTLGVLIGAVRKRWAMVGAIALAVSLGVIFYTLGQTKIYETSAVVMFDPVTPRPLGREVEAVVETGSNQYWNNKEYYTTQHWIIQSERIATAVVKELNLHEDAAFLRNLPSSKKLPAAHATVEQAAARLTSSLTVEPIKNSRLAEVRFRDADPARAQKIVSVLVDTYVQGNLDELTQSTNMAADWLHEQLGSLKKELESSEMALHDYKQKKNILSVSMDDQSNMLREEMTQLNAALTSVRARREQVASRFKMISSVKADNPLALPASEFINSTTLQPLRAQYFDAEQEVQAMTAGGRGSNHPDVKGVVSKREATRTALLAEVKNIQGALERDLAALDNEISGLKRLYDAAQTHALQLNLLEIEYKRLLRSKDNNEKLFSLVMERSKESDLTRMLHLNNIRVVERPALPGRPVTPNVPMNVASGVLLGLLLGIGAAIGREQLDRSIKTPADVERELGLAFLGLLPSLHQGSSQGRPYGGKRRRGEVIQPIDRPELVVHEHPASGIAEAARAIRTNILFMSPDRPFRTLMVTSAGPTEGKTTVACWIAIAMAQAGRRVVLLDCDMRRPRLHRVFDVSKDVGITTALIDLSRVDEIVRRTNVPNLSLVTTGPLPPNPAELLHSDAFGKLLSDLRERFDCVIVDTPPVVPVTDAAVLSASVDGTVLVVRAFQTSRDLARRAVRALGDVGGRIIGSVLNAVDLDGHAYGYQHYYYYKREGYAVDEPAATTSKDEPSAGASPPSA